MSRSILPARGAAALLASLLATAMLATGCADDDVSTADAGDDRPAVSVEPADRASPSAGQSDPSNSTDGTDGPGAGATDGGTTDAETGTAPPAPPGHGAADPQGAVSADPAVLAAARATVSALNGESWEAVYDTSCGALRDGQSREDYVAAFSASGTPGEISGGPFEVGQPVSGEEVDDAELRPVSGTVAWVEITRAGSPEEVAGVARLLDEGGRWTYCGLAQ